MRIATIIIIVHSFLSGAFLSVQARPRQGELQIDSFTPQAEIYVDGELKGQTPLKKPLLLSLGRHTVRVSKMGFGDFVDTVTITFGEVSSLAVDLIPVAGIVEVDSDPQGADVILNGRLVGSTPYRGAVDPGRYILEVSLANHMLYRRNIVLEVGEVNRVFQTLVYRPGGIDDESPQWYKNPWVWAGVAGVVIASTVITAVALSGDDSDSVGSMPLDIETVR